MPQIKERAREDRNSQVEGRHIRRGDSKEDTEEAMEEDTKEEAREERATTSMARAATREE